MGQVPPRLSTVPSAATSPLQAAQNLFAITNIQTSNRVGPDALKIGAVTFNTEECPGTLPIGALEQMIKVHTAIGGSRTVQNLGPSPKEVGWEGRFYAGNVTPRVTQLRLYALTGTPQVLSWRNEVYTVTVKDFTPKYHHRNYAEYSILVEVVSDANGAFSLADSVSVDQQVANLQTTINAANAALVSADPNGTAAFQSSLKATNAALAAAQPLSQNAATQGPSIISQITATVAQVSQYSALLGPLDPKLASSIQMVGSLNLVAQNIARIQAPLTIQQQGGDFFSLASQYYGDATKAYQLMAANNAHSPYLSGAVQTFIKLPQLA